MEMQASRDYDFAEPPAEDNKGSSGITAREKILYGGIGAGAGAGMSLFRSREPYREMRDRRAELQALAAERGRLRAQAEAAKLAQAEAAKAAAAAAPTTPPEVIRKVPESSGAANWGRKLAKDLPYNVAESAESMRKADSYGAQALIDRDIAAKQKIREMGHGAWRMTSAGPEQLMVSPDTATDIVKRQETAAAVAAAEAQAAAKAQALAAAPKPLSGLEEVNALFRKFVQSPIVKYAGPIGGGLDIGVSTAEMLGESRKEKPDFAKMGLTGLGALGTGLSLFPPTAPLGIPLAIGAPAAQYLYETHGQRQAPLDAFSIASPY